VKHSHLLWQLTAASLVTTALIAPARADAIEDIIQLQAANAVYVWQDLHDGSISYDRATACLDQYAKLRAAGGTDATTYTVHTAKPGNPIANKPYTAGQLRDYCQQAKSAAEAADHAKEIHDRLVGVVKGILHWEGELKTGSPTEHPNLDIAIENCNETVDWAKGAGVTDDYVIDTGDGGWKGTLGTMKSVCDSGVEAVRRRYEEVAAPWVAVGMKNDKLGLMVDGAFPSLPGVGGTLDPKKLARANVWFFVDQDRCALGTLWRIERVQFDRDQKITKQTDHEYCGDPPASAWR
jgi:hypothetical protein